MEWANLLSDARRRPKKAGSVANAGLAQEFRTEIERDYDRILFSAPVRRLADKTQVFPLERNDSVRTRLTHSHEVANLCRSLGTHLVHVEDQFSLSAGHRRNIPALLAAVGLAHDLGNPPFGHQGERAIQSWFERTKVLDEGRLTPGQRLDFLRFEGNAQTFRVLTRLQLRNDDCGLNLTYATLAAILKYPTASTEVNKAHVATKKHGYFQSESWIIRDVWERTGLGSGIRHPLTYLMEACDDMAYCVLDAEDAVKKGLVSYSDLVTYLEHHGGNDPLIGAVLKSATESHAEHRDLGLSPKELNDLSMLMFRVHAIGAMIPAVYEAFTDHRHRVERGELHEDLFSASRASALRDVLKSFDRSHAYQHTSVLAVEAQGFQTLSRLMDLLWKAITQRESPEAGSPRTTAFAKYAYQRISENYRRLFEDARNTAPVRYKEAQLLTDMVSGMTDSFAVTLCRELSQYDYESGR